MHHFRGFLLSMVAAFMWGVLPVFLKLCLQIMDSFTITWYRFAFAGIFVFVLLSRERALPALAKLGRSRLLLLVAAAIALLVNYVANVEGLEYVNPETVQVVMQLAPFLLMLGGIFFFGERLSRLEILGALVLLAGLCLFFSHRWRALFATLNEYSVGILIVLLAAVSWAAYALGQKVLLRVLTAKQLTLLIYTLGVLVLLPFASLPNIVHMNRLQLGALLFCCLNTVIAYGAFTEALRIWHAAKVSAVLAITPVFTFLSVIFAAQIWPQYISPSDLGGWSYVGAAMVVAGSMTTALGRGKQAVEQQRIS